MQPEVGLKVIEPALSNNFPVLVFMEPVHHDTVVTRELADVFHDCVAEQLDITAGQRLEAGDGADSELLGLDCTGDGERGVLGAGGLEVDDDADVDAVEDGVERLGRDPGVDP